MEACVRRKLVSPSSTVSARKAGLAYAVMWRSGHCLPLQPAQLLIVTAKPMMVCVTKSVIRLPVVGMMVIALWL